MLENRCSPTRMCRWRFRKLLSDFPTLWQSQVECEWWKMSLTSSAELLPVNISESFVSWRGHFSANNQIVYSSSFLSVNMLRYELYHPHITDIWDLSPPPCSRSSILYFWLFDMPVYPAVVASAEMLPLAVTLISPFLSFFIVVRQVHVIVHTNTRSQCPCLHCLSHTTHKLSETDRDRSLCFIINNVWSDFNTVQTFKTSTSQPVQTSEILFKCVFACMV